LYVQPAADLEFDPPFISSSDRKPVFMIELGSGAGLVAAAIADRLDSPDDLLIATDLPEVINFALFPSHDLIMLGVPTATC
jgi:hypothetical protein